MTEWLPEFEIPTRLWSLLLLPVLILLYIVFLKMKKRYSMRFTNTGLLSRVAASQKRWTRHVAVALSLCSLAALSLAWAKPLGTDRVRRERATVIFIVDVSQSMQANDVEPSRLEAAKSEVKGFVESLPAAFNIGLVELSGSPSVRMPPTVDRGALQRAIDALTFADGTAVGESISSAMDAIALAPPGESEEDQDVPAMIVLLSDGANTTGADPQQATQAAKEKKIPVYSITYGTENGFVDIDGKREPVAPDQQLLQGISQETGGESVSADSAQALREAYKTLDSSFGYEDVKKPITAQYALVALGFAIVASFGAVMMAARWPR